MITPSPPLIIVPTRGGAEAYGPIACASKLAESFGSDVELLSVVADEREAVVRRAELERLMAQLEFPRPTRCKVVTSEDPGRIIEAAGQRGVVCMATSAKMTRHDGHWGSYAEHALRAARHPLLLIGPAAVPDLSNVTRVVAPVDGSDFSETTAPVAAAYATALDVPLWVVSVVSRAQQRQAVAAGVGIESGYVHRIAHPYHGEFEVLHGDDPAERILDFAGADSLVVLSSHGRTGLRRLTAGSVTMSVVAGAKAPVVVVPPGFVGEEGAK